MKIKFYKYQGTGNDFIMIDNRDQTFDATQQEIEWLCHRRYGIGADGLVLLESSSDADFSMVYYNSDGRLSSMCGNGGRCIAAFAVHLGICKPNASLRFEAIDGIHTAQILETIAGGYIVDLEMQPVHGVEQPDESTAILNTGSPHYVMLCNDVESLDLIKEARAIRYNERFAARGINVNFIERVDTILKVRTYERGVEDETYSCGTGVVASYIAAGILMNGFEPQSIVTKGGTLKVKANMLSPGNYIDVHLIGPAVKVFEGEIMISNCY